MYVNFKYIENWSINNLQHKLFALKKNDIVFFLAKEKFSILEKYAFVKLIEEYLTYNKFCEEFDYDVTVFLCKYCSNNYTLNCTYNGYEDKLNYLLTVKDLENLQSLNKEISIEEILDGLNKGNIFGVKINASCRKYKPFLWQLRHKRTVNVKEYLDID